MKVQIKVDINEQTELGQFVSSLYFTPAEYEQLTEQDIANKAKAEADKWVAFVKEQSSKEPEPQPEPTVEELEAQKQILEQQLQEVNNKIEELI